MSSFTAPVRARCSPVSGSSNLGHSTPGVSSSCNPLAMVTHCFCFVTPGRSEAIAFTCPASRLISVDFPTLGTPTIMSRTSRFFTPFFSHFSVTGLAASFTRLIICLTPFPVWQSMEQTGTPSCFSFCSQASVLTGSAISILFNAMTRGLFPAICRSMGLILESGMRASSSSTTTSTSRSWSSIMRRALVICPGNH